MPAKLELMIVALVLLLIGAALLATAIRWYVDIVLKIVMPKYSAPSVLFVVGITVLLFGFAVLTGGSATNFVSGILNSRAR